MKKTLFFLLFFASFAATKAQDKIITVRKDTIECRILSVGAERISYEQKSAENYVTGKSIAISDVLQYFRTGQASGSADRYQQRPVRQKPEHRHLFSLQGGLGHSLTDFDSFKNSLIWAGIASSQADDYVRNLKNGYYISAEFHYLLTTWLGLGVNYTFSQSAAKGEFLVSGYSGFNVPVYLNMNLKENLYTHFIGPSVMFRQFPGGDGKIKITEILSPGIVLFRDESRSNQYQIYWGDNEYYNGVPPQYIDQSNSLTTATAFGAKGGLAFEYCFTPQLSAGLAGNFTWAKLHKVSIKGSEYDGNNQELGEPIDISRIDYGFTVRYNF